MFNVQRGVFIGSNVFNRSIQFAVGYNSSPFTINNLLLELYLYFLYHMAYHSESHPDTNALINDVVDSMETSLFLKRFKY